MMIHMEYYLVVSTIMMFAGIYGFFTRRNTLAILISVELMLNATDINFAVFNRFLFPGELEGYFFALFSIAISAAETAIAIAIMINIYRNIRSIQVKNLDELKAHYTRGGLGDVKVKKFLNNVIQDELRPIRERRKEIAKDIPAVYKILEEGSIKAEKKAAQTLAEMKRAMKINYFEDKELIAEQAARFSSEADA